MEANSPSLVVTIDLSSSLLGALWTPKRVKSKPVPGVELGFADAALPCSEGELRVCAIFAPRAARVVERRPLEREREDWSWGEG